VSRAGVRGPPWQRFDRRERRGDPVSVASTWSPSTAPISTRWPGSTELTGWPIVRKDEDWYQLGRPDTGGATLAFQLAPDHRPPVWPSDDRPQQLHLDFVVDDLDEGERHVLAIGGRKAETQPGEGFRVFLDPAGHPFCLVTE